ncbi:MAG: MarR family winged helix-turn-helix transcriptional regulator [Bacillota bacterium]|nr:MarR family winged helix-turn-helix transcriptional regulator [Bacillota bacterium]
MSRKLCELNGRLTSLHLMRRISIQKETADIGLYFGQLPILEYIKRNENCTQRELADKLQVTAASIALSTKRLQKAGLIKKIADEDNLRCNKLSITGKGLETAENGRKIFDALDVKMYQGFSEEELEDLYNYLNRLIINLTGDERTKINMYTITALENQLKNNEKDMEKEK